MSVGVRRALTTATALMSCSVAALVCAAPAWAAHGYGPGWCAFGTLSYSPDGGPPVVTTPNATALSSGRVADESGFEMTDVHAVLSVQPPSGTSTPGGAGTPLMAWRVNGGAWQPISLTWDGLSGPGAGWYSPDLDLYLDLGRGGQAAIDLETEFVPGSPGGQYVDQLGFTAQTCGSQPLGAGLNFADFQPSAQARASAPAEPAKPAAPAAVVTTGSPSPDRPRRSPTPAPSPSAAAKASPSPSQLKVHFVQVLPSAVPAASSRTGSGLPDGVLVVVAVVFLGGLVCIRVVRRRDLP